MLAQMEHTRPPDPPRGPQATAWGPPPPPSAPRRSGRAWAIIAAALVVLLLVTAAIGVAVTRASKRQEAEQPALFEAGGCVKPDPAQRDNYLPATCDDPAAVGRITKKLAQSWSPSPDCPDDTDLVGTSQLLQTLCVRNLRGPHPGDPGRGGGVLRVGDCVIDPERFSFAPDPEVACADRDAAYRVIARVAKAARCPAGTDKVLDLRQPPRPKVCAGRRAGAADG